MADEFGEPDPFHALIAAHGAPSVLLANTPRRAGYRPYGSAPFLLVRRYVSVPKRRYRDVRAELEAQQIVEVRAGTARGPRGGVRPTWEVALAANVREMDLAAFRRAVAERRVLHVRSERFMGDGDVYMNVIGPDLPDDLDPARFADGFTFVFDPPARLADDDVPVGPVAFFETAHALVDAYWWQHLTEPYAAAGDVSAGDAAAQPPIQSATAIQRGT